MSAFGERIRSLGRMVRKPWPTAAASPSSAAAGPWPVDLLPSDRAILQQASAFTMTSIERQVALLDAVRYVIRRGIAGDFVECGVWRGGSSMIMALALVQSGVFDRDLYLFDTFDGMTPPTDLDRSLDGQLARDLLSTQPRRDASSLWCCASLEEVRDTMWSTGYPPERIHLVKGAVEQTIPAVSPSAIAVLRLDTDWYESTRHEMHHLFPRVSANGVLIVDDYGHWQGARWAIDEYFLEHGAEYLMHRIDYTGRMLIKT